MKAFTAADIHKLICSYFYLHPLTYKNMNPTQNVIIQYRCKHQCTDELDKKTEIKIPKHPLAKMY